MMKSSFAAGNLASVDMFAFVRFMSAAEAFQAQLLGFHEV